MCYIAGTRRLRLEQLQTPEIGPLTSTSEGVVIWMHGLGADAHDFEPIVPHMQLPQVRFVLPNAKPIPVTLNGGHVMRAWYDIRTLGPSANREDAAGIRQSATQIRQLIAREIERGVPANKIVLVGFSQGAAMALYTGLTHSQTLAGIVVLSGYLLLADNVKTHPANAATPLFFGHGQQDGVVPLARGAHARDRVSEGHDTTWRQYPMAHEVSLEEIADLRQWLHARFTA
ncbi:MAG: alpha/beta fold hydrolase [Rhodobacterales bacterium]|nr:alpha/beta fold hydrolase [Rhodobacterales bacterium]